jgi:TPR repeat protein
MPGRSKKRMRHARGDYTTELRLVRPLAERGDAEAQEALGTLYVMGDGVVQDYVEAVKWFREAAEQGFAEAQDDLARMYVQGQGVPKNLVQAHMWFNLAAARRRPGPADINVDAAARDNLAAEMTPEQIAEAQRLAREWKPKSH